jgi:hypothetical protein
MHGTDQVTLKTYPRLYVPSPEDYPETAIDLAEFVAIPQTAALFEPPPTDDVVTTNPLFQRRYLVLLTGVSEDIPVGLFEDPDEAGQFARDVYDNPDAHAARYFDATQRDMSLRNFRWLTVSVIEFSGPVPMNRAAVFHFGN